MAKNNRRRNRPKVPGTHPTAVGPFDPNANYGRTKGGPYHNTGLGQRDANRNPADFYRFLLDKGGISGTGTSPFHQWANTSGLDIVERGYASARQTNPKLGFQNYMQSAFSVPGDARNYVPVDTGNAFTSSSGVNLGGKGGKKGNRPVKPMGMGASATSLQPFTDYLRREFNKLTPEQSGEYMAGYAFGPTRWSVFG